MRTHLPPRLNAWLECCQNRHRHRGLLGAGRNSHRSPFVAPPRSRPGGLSWQIVPELLFTLVRDENPAKAQAVMAAMLQMGKIDSAALQLAHDEG